VLLELIFMLCILGVFLLLFYFNAGIFYDFQIKLKKDENPILKIIGQDTKFLDNKEEWVKKYRRKMFLLAGLVGAVILVVFVSLLI